MEANSRIEPPNRASTAVPAPGTEWMSKTSAIRLTAPRPVPGPPPVENPSSRAWATLRMPGPRSSASRSSVPPPPSLKTRPTTTPPPACRSRLVASSVATMAASPARVALKPSCSAAAWAKRRTSPTSLESATVRSRDGASRLFLWGTSFPPNDRHAGPLTRFGMDLELVHEPLRPSEAESHSVPCRVSVFHGQLDIGDSRTFVLEHQPQTAAVAVLHHLEVDGAAPAVDQRVPRQLARGGDHLGLVDEAELQLDAPRPHRLPDLDDLRFAADGQELSARDDHSPVLCRCARSPARGIARPSRPSARSGLPSGKGPVPRA